jgi:Glyoxalase-like domain
VDQAPRLALSGVVLDSPDASALAGFYRRLLGWAVEQDEPGWVKLRSPDGGLGLSFQTEPAYAAPVWPAGPGDQQMQLHLDIAVGIWQQRASARSLRGRSWPAISPRAMCASTSILQATRFAFFCLGETASVSSQSEDAQACALMPPCGEAQQRAMPGR